MSKYYVEVSIPGTSEYAHASFKSGARTEAGILRAAKRALSDKGYHVFKDPTAMDVAARVNGKLVYVITYQKMGLFK